MLRKCYLPDSELQRSVCQTQAEPISNAVACQSISKQVCHYYQPVISIAVIVILSSFFLIDTINANIQCSARLRPFL